MLRNLSLFVDRHMNVLCLLNTKQGEMPSSSSSSFKVWHQESFDGVDIVLSQMKSSTGN